MTAVGREKQQQFLLGCVYQIPDHRKVIANLLGDEKGTNLWREKSAWRVCVLKRLRSLQMFRQDRERACPPQLPTSPRITLVSRAVFSNVVFHNALTAKGEKVPSLWMFVAPNVAFSNYLLTYLLSP